MKANLSNYLFEILAETTNSLLSSHDLKLKILDQPVEACPTNIPAALLAQLTTKQGEEATKENLYGVTQKGGQSTDPRDRSQACNVLLPN